MFGFTNKRRTFIVEEKDVTTVLGVINRKRRQFDCCVGNCGWNNEDSEWFIMFHDTDKMYGSIVKELQKIGELTVDVRPGEKVVLVFRMGS